MEVKGGGGVTACLPDWLADGRGTAALACRMHMRVHTAPGPAQYPFLALSLSAAPSLLAPLPSSLFLVLLLFAAHRTAKWHQKPLENCYENVLRLVTLTPCDAFPTTHPSTSPPPSSARSLCSLYLAIGHATSKQWLQLATTTTRVAQTVCKASTSCQLNRTNSRNQVKI